MSSFLRSVGSGDDSSSSFPFRSVKLSVDSGAGMELGRTCDTVLEKGNGQGVRFRELEFTVSSWNILFRLTTIVRWVIWRGKISLFHWS